MTDKDFHSKMQFKAVGGGLLPSNSHAVDFVSGLSGKELVMKEVTARDLNFHRAYFGLLSFIHRWMPVHFKERVDEYNFYMWLKHAQGNYKVLFDFKDGTRLVEYDSISFGRMSQEKFRGYVREQLTWIYANLIETMFTEDQAPKIIESIEYEFENYLNTL